LAGTFPLDRKHALEVFNEILRRKLKIEWGASTRVDTLDKDLLEVMKHCGCKYLQIGVESGESEILKSCAKAIDLEYVERVFELCKKLGIRAGANFILGLPHETKETLLKTHKFALRILKNADNVNFAILVPYPGTKVYEMALNNEHGLGIKSKDWIDYGKQAGEALKHDNFANGQLAKYQTRFYLSCCLHSPIKLMKHFSWKRFFQLMNRFNPKDRSRQNEIKKTTE
jgi:radical SAM superfamily enzyme YgiQ (UPF0313 family)